MVKSGTSGLQSKVLASFSRYSDIQQDVVQFLFETTLLILFDIYCQTLLCKIIQLVSRYVKSRNIFVSNRACYEQFTIRTKIFATFEGSNISFIPNICISLSTEISEI